VSQSADPSLAALPSPRPSLLRRGLRLLGWLALAALLLLALAVTLLRYVILPQIGDYKAEIEAAASGIVGQRVSIGQIDARWQGLNPDLILDDLRLLDAAGEPTLTLARVEGVLSWQSLWRWRPVLALLAFDGPVLHIRRDGEGHLTIAGMPAAADGDSGFADWALAQKRIRIRDATIVWDDQWRGAPPLVLEDLQLALDNRGRDHRFGLSALPPKALADRLEVRGEISGEITANPAEALAKLTGRIYVQLDYADLAGWRAWLDYPLDLPQGRGALRVWGDLADGGGALTADLALEDVRLRLQPGLPELDLDNLRGRLTGRYQNGVWSLRGEKLELLTRRGLRIVPTDFAVEWTQKPGTPGGDLIDGKASASFMDLGALAALAEYLPLDQGSRQLLRRHRPQGQIAGLTASWGFADGALKRYAVKADFSGLGMQAGGYFPGSGGLGGHVDMTERGGRLSLDNGRSSLLLPAVFPEAEILLDTLRGEAEWTVNGQEIEVRLPRFEFASPDAAGEAHGRYRFTGEGPGVIDLEAGVTRARAAAVWRYMPHVVNANARAWLRRGLVDGRGYDGRLTLKGNLADFPFRDGQGGQFSITAKVAAGRVDYADGWPPIEDIDADLEFGVGMSIRARSGRVLGARLSGVSAVMPDFNVADEILLVRGAAAGPTGEFFRFIATSPVAASIHHATDGMKAKGDGQLELELDLPMQRIEESRVRGHYRLHNNELAVVDGLPPLLGVSGQLDFTESSLTAKSLAGRVFGGPFKARIAETGGKTRIEADGHADVAEVIRHFGWPLAGRLSGNAAWQAAIGIGKDQVETAVSSDLTGIASTLPPPLDKAAAAMLPLRLEQTYLAGGGEQFRLSLGALAAATLQRRAGAWERGVVALGESAVRLLEKTPDKATDRGLNIRIALPSLDADAWRSLLSPEATTGAGGLARVTLATPLLRLLGRDYHRVNASLSPTVGGWRADIDSVEANGDLLWRGEGKGRLEGHLRRLIVTSAAADEDSFDSLPDMALLIDDFRLGAKDEKGERALGRLELKARNADGVWRMDQLSLQNPDGAFTGKGLWANAGARHQTQLEFDLNVRDAGKLLTRLGYVDAVRRGTATLSGALQWNGPLTDMDYLSLSGQLSVKAEKGQFNKLDPGVGKLLGLISLQSLPRRLSLDFRDIFSEGLAFDSIDSHLAIDRGVMRTTEPLRITGPAAQVDMEGEADLRHETQNLNVVVRPEVGNLAAVGTAALINPVAGAAALVATNTVLKKPLSRLFSYRYHVTGSWSDPQVDKVEPREETANFPLSGAKP
jgi:uncharacterized protein (TIGR02099 family)